MSFFTEVNIEDFGWKISHRDKLTVMGSCFAENIGEKFRLLKFQADVNPFGVVYNPLSVANGIRRLLSGKPYSEADIFEHRGIWGSFDHHGSFSSLTATETLTKINDRLDKSAALIREARYIFITFGTAWAYEIKDNGRIASNCHKIPASEFKPFRIAPGTVVDEYRELLTELWTYNPSAKIVFTVSPIRHWKNGPIANQLSKATLLLAIDRIIEGFGKERCCYFPSYEIVMDELRDYRFYAPDMMHISQTATDYIWEKFCRSMVAEDSLNLAKDIHSIVRAAAHRPVHTNAPDYMLFLYDNLAKIAELTNTFPFLNFQEEKRFFEEKLLDYK